MTDAQKKNKIMIMEPIYQVAYIAKLLGLRRETIYRKVKAGEIPAVRIGGSLRFPESLIKGWLAGKAGEPSDRWGASLTRLIALLKTEWGGDLRSAVLFGSFATGRQRPESDIDLLLISSRFPKSRLERQGILFDLAKRMSPPFAHKLSPVLLTPDEGWEIKPLYLGMMKAHRVLHDDGFFSDILERTRRWLEETGVEEQVTADGLPYWVFPKESIL